MKQSIVFICALSMFAFFSCEQATENKAAQPAKAAPTTYTSSPAVKGNLLSSETLPAQLMAYEEVSIFPKINGYVKNVLVDIGSQVRAGQVLMRLEAPEMEEQSLSAKEKYARSVADYSISKEHYNRLLEASGTAGAISPLDLSSVRAKMMADSSLSNAERANYAMEKDLNNYLVVTAPFAGVITERNVDQGSLVNNSAKDGKPMLELKQINKLRLTVDVPENIAGRLKEGDTIHFTVSAVPGKYFTGTISRMAMNINAQYHVEKTEIDVANNQQQLKPGMYADVVFKMGGNNSALIVPRSSVVTSTERKYVLVLKDNTITKVDVTTGNETPDKAEVFGNLHEGDEVIINANDEIQEGVVH